MTRPRLGALAATLFAALALAACGEDREEGSFTNESPTGTGTGTTGGSGTGTTPTPTTTPETSTATTPEAGAETTPEGGTGTTPEDEGGDSGGAAAPPQERVSRRLAVAETEFKLRPRVIQLARSGVVEFLVRNEGQVPHALEVEGPTGEFETEAIEPGGRARLRADLTQSGEYKLYCPIGDHEDRGMTGLLRVRG